MTYNLQDNLRHSVDDDDLLNANRSFRHENSEELTRFLHRGNFFSSNPKNLMMKRKRKDLYKIIKKSLSLLLSPRTILVQLESFLFIYIVTKFDAANQYTKNFGISVDIRVITLMVSFCVIFAINQSFARRERTLQDVANLKTSIIMIYYSMSNIYHSDDDKKANIYRSCKNLFKYLSEYIYDRNELIHDKLYSMEQNRAVQLFYSDINRLLKLAFDCGDHHHHHNCYQHQQHKNNRDSLFESMDNGLSKIPAPVIVLLTNRINGILESFERLCATKDYLTPLGIRAFVAFMLWFLPIILAPYFVWHTDNEIHDIASYAWSWLFFLMLGALVDVKNILDDIFDGDSIQDDVVLDTQNILKNMKYGASPLLQDLYHDK